MLLIKNVSNSKIKDIEDKILDTTNLANNININTKINAVKNKISNISNLATYTALTAGERE